MAVAQSSFLFNGDTSEFVYIVNLHLDSVRNDTLLTNLNPNVDDSCDRSMFHLHIHTT